MYGGGAEVETRSVPRMYVSAKQLDHFLDFITSEHIIQELPFGERTLKLSSEKKITVPKMTHFAVIPPSKKKPFDFVRLQTSIKLNLE